MACRLCGQGLGETFRQRILGHIDAAYFRCPDCDLIQTEPPFWLSEAYSTAMSTADAGAIRRNQLTADLTSGVAWVLGLGPKAKCLDDGGGHGVFVRMMRDRGWDFRLCDRYAENIFARGFDGSVDEHFDLVTAFEVFEHFVDVSGEIERIFAPRPEVVLISTQLHRGHQPGWWYYMPESGQHVAFYSEKTMRHIAWQHGYDVAGSRAYTLFIRRGADFAGWRKAAAQWMVRRSRGDRNHGWLKTLLRAGPRFESRIIADSGITPP